MDPRAERGGNHDPEREGSPAEATINASRKATVAYLTINLTNDFLIRIFYVMNLQKMWDTVIKRAPEHRIRGFPDLR